MANGSSQVARPMTTSSAESEDSMEEDYDFYDPEGDAQEAADEAPAEDAAPVAEAQEEEVTPAEEESTPDDPWGWAKDLDPSKVRKTFEKFTPEWEAVKATRAELEAELEKLGPTRSLFNELQSDAGLQRAIEAYYAEGEGAEKAAEKKTAELEERLANIEIKARVENEVAVLRNKVQAAGDPDFDDAKLITFAGDNMLPSLEFAYKLMYHDELVEAAEQRAFDSIKQNAKAKVTTVTKASEPAKVTTLDDLEDMTDEEFLARVRNK